MESSTSPARHALSHDRFAAVIFDLDGVVTQTAAVHAAAWKALFDEYLSTRAARTGAPWHPFDIDADYRRYVDGKPRYLGVSSFLESRGIRLDYGSPDDPPERETICGLGNRKNELFNRALEERGVQVFDSTVALIHSLRSSGFKTAVVSSSKNTVPILESAHLRDLFDAKVDGVDAAERGLPGKPAPDTFLAACDALHVEAKQAVVVEDAVSGVEAGVNGAFGLVIGVDRGGNAARLQAAGADWVVEDLEEVRAVA